MEYAELLETAHQRIVALARGAGFDVPPPATDDEIDEAQQRLGLMLPRAYRRFLELQNGWPRAWLEISLLGVQDLEALDAEGFLVVGRAEQDQDVLAFDMNDPETSEPPFVLRNPQSGKEVARFDHFDAWLAEVAG